MRTTTRGRRFRVIDGFLSEPGWDSVQRAAAEVAFDPMPSVVDAEVDGIAYRSAGSVVEHDAVEGSAGGRALPLAGYLEVLREAARHEDLFGTAGRDWTFLGLSFWCYPAGSRLGWHNDAGVRRRGEFVLFLHEGWASSWGGELMILDVDPDDLGAVGEELSPFEASAARVDSSDECLVAIVPKPNRLVLVQEGTIHCIRRVDEAAGTHVRRTMTGFLSSREPAQRRPERQSAQRLATLLGSG